MSNTVAPCCHLQVTGVLKGRSNPDVAKPALKAMAQLAIRCFIESLASKRHCHIATPSPSSELDADQSKADRRVPRRSILSIVSAGASCSTARDTVMAYLIDSIGYGTIALSEGEGGLHSGPREKDKCHTQCAICRSRNGSPDQNRPSPKSACSNLLWLMFVITALCTSPCRGGKDA